MRRIFALYWHQIVRPTARGSLPSGPMRVERQPGGKMTHVQERFLERKMTEIEQARSWSPRVISKLEALIRSGDDLALYRVNPLAVRARPRHSHVRKRRSVPPCGAKRVVRDELGRGVPPIGHGARLLRRL